MLSDGTFAVCGYYSTVLCGMQEGCAGKALPEQLLREMCIRDRVVVAHMDAGLVDVGCPHKGRGVTLQHKDALALSLIHI